MEQYLRILNKDIERNPIKNTDQSNYGLYLLYLDNLSFVIKEMREWKIYSCKHVRTLNSVNINCNRTHLMQLDRCTAIVNIYCNCKHVLSVETCTAIVNIYCQ